MNSTLAAALSSWPHDPWLAAGLFSSLAIYFRGWQQLRHRDTARWSAWRLLAAFSANVLLYLALASPIEAFAGLLLQAHMAQHLLLTMCVPPLVWLSAPLLPMLHGLPIEIRRVWIVPLLFSRPVRGIGRITTHPIAAWCIFVGITLLWHLPALYELALANRAWHMVQHFSFLAAGLIFWWPVVRPFPARPRWNTWWLVPYLLLADVQNTALAAVLTFAGVVLYPHYEAVPRLAGISALDDQAAAGVLMWVPGSVLFLVPLGWIGVRLMFGARAFNGPRLAVSTKTISPRCLQREAEASGVRGQGAGIKSREQGRFDLFRLPLVGSLLQWRGTRTIVRCITLLVLLAVIVDGLFGPQAAPLNLAGVLPWIHWRGLLIFGLLFFGNLFCYGCPFTLPRSIARQWLPAANEWPTVLRNKWLAVLLLATYLWAYEAYALWNSPWLTAWIALTYLVGALVIDGYFRDAAFCKYVCPVGQFNFVLSTVSPLSVQVRQPAVCAGCTSHDCLATASVKPVTTPQAPKGGCELKLFQPKKVGNLDCTFCLDCASACPHENVGIFTVKPMAELWRDSMRSGIGRLSGRLDYAVLALVLVFGALANAAGMIGPVQTWQRELSESLGLGSTFWATSVFYVVGLGLLPAVLVTIAATATRSSGEALAATISRFAWSLVPLGFAVWLAHYGFHFVTSFMGIVPATQRFSGDFGLASLGSPDWQCACCQPAPTWLLRAEIVALGVGLSASAYVAFNIAASMLTKTSASPTSAPHDWRAAVVVSLPWIVVASLLYGLAVWILLQPMEMRGTL